MEYTISQLAEMAGVSTRTLRYYDDSGLLPSRRNSVNEYRLYGRGEVQRLQQIGIGYRFIGRRGLTVKKHIGNWPRVMLATPDLKHTTITLPPV